MSTVLNAAKTIRYDPEYFQKQHLVDAELVRQNSNTFQAASELGIRVDASAFYPSIEAYYDTGDVPFYRVGDVEGIIDVEKATRIPIEICSRFLTLKTVKPGDILFTKGGAIDRTGYVTSEGAVSRDLIFLNTSCISRSKRLLLFTYFRTAFFRRMLLRSSSQTTQPHLTITLVRELPFFSGSSQIAETVASTVTAAFQYTDVAVRQVHEAEGILFSALGLAGWDPPKPLSYTARAKEVFAARRMDAQFFSIKFDELRKRLLASGAKLKTIRDIRFFNSRGLQPEYVPDGNVYVVNSRHILEARIDYENFERTNRKWLRINERAQLQSGDILTYTTGAKIGRTAHFQFSNSAVASNHVNILRLSEGDPEYVAFVMNSLIGRLQTERYCSGTAQPELYPGDIDKFIVPFIPAAIQTTITNKLQRSEELRSRSRRLLDIATRSVEIAVEEGESAAINFLDQAGNAS